MTNRFIPMIVYKNPDLSITMSFVTILLITTSGCDNNRHWEMERVALQSQKIDLQRRHDLLNSRIDSLWDATSAELATGIPMNFASEDRDIFVKARNADHIRMFMSFQTLDTALQSLVNRAGDKDVALAVQVHALLQEQREYEVRKNQFLQKVERQDVSASREYAELFRHTTR